MKIEITLEDRWIDGEWSLGDALRAHIKSDTVNQIHKNLKEQIDKEVETAIKAEVEKSLHAFIQQEVIKCIAGGQVKESSYSDAKMVDLSKWIENEFKNNTGYRSPKDQIQKLAKKFGDEMKQRYDLLFASQIVAKMSDNGLLKEGAAELLLDEKQ